MQNHIIIEPASKIREIARNALAGFWKPVIIGMLIYYMLTSGVELLLDGVFVFSNPVNVYDTNIVQNIPYGGSIYIFILGGPFELGITIFLLTFFRKRKTDNTLIFEGFSHFGKAFLLLLLMSVKIMLWSFLFVVPGIIASFRYSQSFYILADNPDMSVGDCIKESCRLMAGNKGRYFYLQLTFIGWYILASIPRGIFTTFSDGTGALAIILGIVLSLPMVVVDAYLMMANTAFYELATENLVVMKGAAYGDMVNAEYSVKEESMPAENTERAEAETPATEDNATEERPE